MRFRRKREDEPGIGITPLIDIVFILLIFFMLTSHSYIVSGHPVNLPRVGKKERDRKEDKVSLVIDASGRAFYRGKEIDDKRLLAELKEVVKKNDMASLFLEADRRTAHGRVVMIMDLAKQAGIPTIIIAAQWDPQKVL